jgi:hypothetical protein
VSTLINSVCITALPVEKEQALANDLKEASPTAILAIEHSFY